MSAKVALTFDDGPNPQATPQILSVLKNHKVKATFFVVGKNVENYPEITKQIASNSHEIEVHSWDHSISGFFKTPMKLKTELEKTKELVKSQTGQNPTYFRPPWGVTTPWISKGAKLANLKTIRWTLDSHDSWLAFAPSTKSIVSSLSVKLKEKDIVLFHDGQGTTARPRQTTLDSVDEFIKMAKSKKFQFVTLKNLK